MGPMIDIASVKRVDSMVEDAIAAGAKVVLRGGPFKDGPLAKGAFYRPTLLEISDHSMPIAQEEVFGPVLIMQAFDPEEEEAVALANDSQYGLAASIWSSDVDRPLRIARQIEAGTVWINNWAITYAEIEEGGYKQSGLGRLDGVSPVDDFVEYRTIIHEIDLRASH
jgi:betaine-aldehyde dehydrogenase